MGVSHLYTNFGAGTKEANAKTAEDNELQREEIKLQSFEDGYKSGWDDAISAQNETHISLSSDLAVSLQEASFVYHEVRATLAKELQETIEPLLITLLPKVASDSLHSQLLEKVMEVSKQIMDRPIEIAVPPNRMAIVNQLFEDSISEPFQIISDDTMKDDQVMLKIGNVERELSVENWTEDALSLVRAFFEQAARSK